MKPKTKQQREIVALQATIPTFAQLESKLKPWAFETCIKHLGYRTKASGISCLSCGHVWKEGLVPNLITVLEPTNEVCPNCNRQLEVTSTRKKKLTQLAYYAYVQTCGGYQVNRLFQIFAYHNCGKAPVIFTWEIIQQWQHPGNDGIKRKDQVFARQNGGLAYYQTDSFGGELVLREPETLRYKYDVNNPFVYPEVDCLPEYRRNGFDGVYFGNISPFVLFGKLLKDNIVETLYKANYRGFLEARLYQRPPAIGRYWNSVKICMRNNYNLPLEEVVQWLDYLDLLHRYNKDLSNPALVCPADLKAEHDRYVRKADADDERRDRMQREREQQAREKRRVEAEAKFNEWRSKFFHLSFTDGLITIEPLKSVGEFKEEGDKLKHCVYKNAYYADMERLVLSARINGEPIETIEVNLKNYTIVQARGYDNSPTRYHAKIIRLMRSHMIEVVKANGVQKKKKTVEDLAA